MQINFHVVSHDKKADVYIESYDTPLKKNDCGGTLVIRKFSVLASLWVSASDFGASEDGPSTPYYF